MSWTEKEVHELVEKQKVYFKTGATLDVKWRLEQLDKLKKAVEKHKDELIDALGKDLGRSKEEAYLCDVGSVLIEINEAMAGLKRWARPETHFSGFVCFPSIFTKVYKMPYGTVLIIAPFNFPFMLSIGVLAASIAAGNTAVVKMSSKSPNCTAALDKLISDTFPEEFCRVIDGGHDVADRFLAEKFDKIFYTGSPKVAKHIMTEAAKNLTPVALELGGETGNWAIVRKDADLKDAARKIAFFKILNSGQICINVNQVAVAEDVADEFVELLKAEFTRQIGEGSDALENPEYPKLINSDAYNKCVLDVKDYRDKIVFGGIGKTETCQYAPTIIYPVHPDDNIVNHELFSPLLPVVSFRDDDVDSLLDVIASREHGLALYVFTKDIKWANKVMSTQQFGGGCINEVCVHLMVKGVPFNGTGHSGMGAYHGEWGFREFTHPTTVLKGYSRFNLPLREHPFSGKKNSYKMKLLRFFEQ